MKHKIFILPLLIALLSAGCNFFQTPPAAGVVKTVNGGVDWQFSNVISGSKTESLAGLNISKLDFDPQNRETVYAGSFSGGLFKSTDSGASWSRILSKIFVYDFIVSPVDSKTIYVAGSFNDQGKVLKTQDGGATWTDAYNEATKANPVRAIAFNPSTSNQLIIGTDSGNLVKSADSGLSWQLSHSFNNRINKVLWQQDGIYVLLKDKGLFKSSAGDSNFQDLTPSLGKSSTFDFSYDNTLSYNQNYVDPFSTSLIYLTTSRGIYKTVDSGQNWNLLPLPVQSTASNARSIAVAKSSSNIVYTSVGPVIYKSTDGGQTWQTQAIVTVGYIDYILIDPALPQIAYGGVYVAQ